MEIIKNTILLILLFRIFNAKNKFLQYIHKKLKEEYKAIQYNLNKIRYKIKKKKKTSINRMASFYTNIYK